MANNALRILTKPERFSFNVSTVARPIAVRGTNTAKVVIPRKMVLPALCSWIEQRNQRTVYRIGMFRLVVFMTVATRTSQGQIFQIRFAVFADGHDVFHGKRLRCKIRLALAILATPFRALNDGLPFLCSHIASSHMRAEEY